ncbi:hypothetical protein [Acidianus sp. RZ1]|uniref:hypothetical protein n=1 Tax=Acidianus sp. RZ1 TaxID=1540082 RepID=UPI00149245F2|nr:hypothetical protein [Acidianus sp. RZ1]NON62769.1 hypothetical protein [Acidianus sp. RZ1]
MCSKTIQDTTFNSVSYGRTDPLLIVINGLSKEVRGASKRSGSVAISSTQIMGSVIVLSFIQKPLVQMHPYILNGDYNSWKSIAQGYLDAIQAVLSGNISLGGIRTT